MPTLNLGRVRFNWRGEYNPLADYQEYDTVKADGQSYVCIGDVSGVGPLDPDGGLYWDSMLVRGADYNAARDQALQFANDSQESATLAGARANEAQDAAAESAASMEMAERWANEEEDVEVSPGEFSAYHWYKKAEALGSPNEFDLTADQTSDTRKSKEWMAQVLANQQSLNDAHQTLQALKAGAFRTTVGGDGPLIANTDELREKYRRSASVSLNFQQGEYFLDEIERYKFTDFNQLGSYSRSSPISIIDATGRLRDSPIDQVPRSWLLGGRAGAIFFPARTNYISRSLAPWLSPWSAGGSTYFNNERADEIIPGLGIASVAHYGPTPGNTSFSTSVARQSVTLPAGIYCISAIFKSIGDVPEPTVRTLHRAIGIGSGTAGSLLGSLSGQGGARGSSQDSGSGSFGQTQLLYCRPIGNGYFEFAERMQLLEEANVEIRHFPYSGGGSFSGDGVAGLLRTSIQVEQGSWPTPIIDTTASPASRTVSQAQIVRSVGDFSYKDFTIFVDVHLSNFSQQDHADSTQGVMSISSGASTKFVSLITRSDAPRLRWLLSSVNENGSLTLDVLTGDLASIFGRRHRVAISIRDGLQIACANGGEVVSASEKFASEFLKDWDRLVLMGYYAANNRRSYGAMCDVMIIPKSLSETQLKELTQS